MAAPRTHTRASANAGKSAASRRSSSRAASSRTPARSASTTRSRSAARKPASARGARRSAGSVRLTTIAVIGTIIVAAWTVYPVLRLQYQHQREVQTLESELSGLRTRNEELRDQVDELKTPQGVEQLARESLGLVKPGETAYVVTGGASADTSATVTAAEVQTEPLWRRALDVVFGFD